MSSNSATTPSKQDTIRCRSLCPGTLFHKAMKARSRINEIVGRIIDSRRGKQRAGAGEAAGTDLFWSFLEAKEGLTGAQISDNVIGVIFAARDTTTTVLTWVVKFLGDNSSVLQIVIHEQEEIKREKEEAEEGKRFLEWADVKRMPVTVRVIHETMRVASILSFTFREAIQDVEYEDHSKAKQLHAFWEWDPFMLRKRVG